MTDNTEHKTSGEAVFGSLLRTFGLLRRVMEPYFATVGINVSHWAILKTLYKAKEEGQTDLRLCDISDRLIVRPPSVTRVVESLNRLGWVEWKVSSTDSRAKQVRLTAAGNELVERTLVSHGQKVNEIMAGLSQEELIQLSGLLERLGDELGKRIS